MEALQSSSTEPAHQNVGDMENEENMVDVILNFEPADQKKAATFLNFESGMAAVPERRAKDRDPGRCSGMGTTAYCNLTADGEPQEEFFIIC